MIWAWLAVVTGFVGTNVVWWLRVRDLQRQLELPVIRRRVIVPPPPPRDPMTRTQLIPINTFPFYRHKEINDEQ